MKKKVLVVFKKNISKSEERQFKKLIFNCIVIAPLVLRDVIGGEEYEWVDIDSLVGGGNIREASELAKELSSLKMMNGIRLTKTFIYEGYEMWWIYYQKIYLYLCLPYSQYKNLLKFLRKFDLVCLYQPPYKDLFSFYFEAHNINFKIFKERQVKSPVHLPLGIIIQILLTVVSLPVLILCKPKVMVFTGDLLQKGNDYDFRMKYIYEELRKRKIIFFEIIRSLEPWNDVLRNAFVRKRPVVYSEGVVLIGRWISMVTPNNYFFKNKLRKSIFAFSNDSSMYFKYLLASQFLINSYDEVWAIRITKGLLKMIGTQAAYITAPNDRNFHALIGCKLCHIPTVGILHGFSPCDYNVYDFLPAYDGNAILSVDKYGLWSEWWKKYYLENSRVYSSEQLEVSGPMRPFKKIGENIQKKIGNSIKVLFIAEQLAVPEEVFPYLKSLLATQNISVYVKFRPQRDGFESWLLQYHPEVMGMIDESKILRGEMQGAVAECDVVVGSHGTAVPEALLAGKPMVFFDTKKWGDCYGIRGYHSEYNFYAENENQLIECIQKGVTIPVSILEGLRERFFGDAHQNGSSWVVDQLATFVKK